MVWYFFLNGNQIKIQEKWKQIIQKIFFFAKQTVQDACATQAILGVLLNLTSEKIKIGETLNEFKSFTSSFSPEEKGDTIGVHDLIRKAHNSFSEPELFVFDEKDKSGNEKGDAFHFISYVPFKGIVYEIDGLKSGPYKICEYSTEDEWIEKTLSAIKKRTETYSETDHFSLMAMIHDQKDVFMEQIEQLKKKEAKNETEKIQIEK